MDCWLSDVQVDFIFRTEFLSTGPVMYGQSLPNDIQMYNYIQMLNYTAKLNLNSGSSSEALNSVTGYSAPNRPQVSTLDRINPVLPKKDSSKVSCVKIIASMRYIDKSVEV
jgi:hypothetical protein